MSNASENDKPNAPNPFDPDSLRISGGIDSVGAEKILVRIAVRKPIKQEFFRVHATDAYRLPCAIYEDKEEREYYLVTPKALPVLLHDVRNVELRLCENRQGVLFLWPVPMPNPDGRTNSWHESARSAASLAETSWIRMVAKMAEGAYSIYRATGNLPDPLWTDKDLRVLLELSFKDGFLIDSEDHPIVQKLNGA